MDHIKKGTLKSINIDNIHKTHVPNIQGCVFLFARQLNKQMHLPHNDLREGVMLPHQHLGNPTPNPFISIELF